MLSGRVAIVAGRLIRSAWVALVAATLLTACQKPNTPPVTGTDALADSAEQVMYPVAISLVTDGVQKGELKADTAYVFNDQTLFIFRNPRVTFNKETGAPNGTMSADRGNYDLRTQVMEGFGHVVITTTDGRRLESPHVKFDQVDNIVSSDTSYVVTEGDRVQRGIGFTSDPNLNRFSCKRMCGGSAPITIPDR